MQITLQSSFGVNTTQVMSAQDLLMQYLPGVELKDRNGNTIPETTITTHLERTLVYLENYLGIKLRKQIIEEDKDFNRDDFMNYQYVKTSYPVVFAIQMDGHIGNVAQVKYPQMWLAARQSNDGGAGWFRRIQILPHNNASFSQQVGVMYTGIYPISGFLNTKQIPNYWKLKYITGWDSYDLPQDVLQAYAMMSIVSLAAAISYGMSPFFGITNQSLSLDGLSQSTGSAQNSNSLLFSPLIKSYLDQLRGPSGMLENLRSVYGDFVFAVG